MNRYAAIVWFCCLGVVSTAQAQTNVDSSLIAARPADVLSDGQHDFDWEIGSWRTQLARRVNPLSGSAKWLDYTGTTVVRPVWNGKANLVELAVDGAGAHLEGLSLRLYNPQSKQWTLNFSNAASGTMATPATGGFKNGRGEFYGTDTLADGRVILVRFIITNLTPKSWRFEQAYSADVGKTWEVNWVVIDTRTSDATPQKK